MSTSCNRRQITAADQVWLACIGAAGEGLVGKLPRASS
jgi:hypothetical protein